MGHLLVLPFLTFSRFQIEQLVRDKHALEVRLRAKLKEMDEVKRDLDINMNSFLAEESVGKDKASEFQLTFKQVGSCLKSPRGLYSMSSAAWHPTAICLTDSCPSLPV